MHVVRVHTHTHATLCVRVYHSVHINRGQNTHECQQQVFISSARIECASATRWMHVYTHVHAFTTSLRTQFHIAESNSAAHSNTNNLHGTRANAIDGCFTLFVYVGTNHLYIYSTILRCVLFGVDFIAMNLSTTLADTHLHCCNLHNCKTAHARWPSTAGALSVFVCPPMRTAAAQCRHNKIY